VSGASRRRLTVYHGVASRAPSVPRRNRAGRLPRSARPYSASLWRCANGGAQSADVDDEHWAGDEGGHRHRLAPPASRRSSPGAYHRNRHPQPPTSSEGVMAVFRPEGGYAPSRRSFKRSALCSLRARVARLLGRICPRGRTSVPLLHSRCCGQNDTRWAREAVRLSASSLPCGRRAPSYRARARPREVRPSRVDRGRWCAERKSSGGGRC